MKDYILCLCLDKLSAELTFCEELKRNECLNKQLISFSLCLSSLSARQLRYCLYGDCKGARPDHSARPQTTAHLEWSRRVFKLYPLAPILFPPLNSTMPPFSLWAALHEPETSSLHPLPLTPTAKELNTTCQQPKYWKSRCAAVSLDMMLTSRCLVKLNYNRINVSVSLSVS